MNLTSRSQGRDRLLLTLGGVAVAFAAVDTYVVVLALPDMMAGVGISVEQLQRAAPIVSGFLLGYVAMLPLIGRIADLRGPVPVLRAALLLFSLGSLLTAMAPELATMVVGRFLQGVGGGGLVPATMAMVAARYPVERRGLPLGVISAVQEFGSVLGPLYGAVILSVTTWRSIFMLNLFAGLALAGAVALTGRFRHASSPGGSSATQPPRGRHFPDVIGWLLLATFLVAGLITYLEPDAIKRDVSWGQMFIPYVDGGSRWITPVGVTTIGAAVVLLLWCLFAPRPVLDLRGWARSMRGADPIGALLLSVVLAGIVLAFATADPQVSVFAPQGWWYLAGSVLAGVLLVLHLRVATAPVVPAGLLRPRPAWGAIVVSFLVGWSLIAALIDIPLFARTTVYPDSQLDAAMVLLRFLVALPIGAVIGGWLLRRLPAGPVAGVGLLCAALSDWLMSGWGMHSLEGFASNLPLVLGGLGFGLALAPVNAAILASTPEDSHGVASALVVVARMVGMLVGISALTTIGLRRLYAAREAHPDWELDRLGVLQETAVFAGAAVTALVAAVLAFFVFRSARTRSVDLAETLRAAG